MSALVYLVVCTGLTAGVVLQVVAVAKGRVAPIRRVPWIVALVVLGLDTALHVAASVGMVVAAGLEAGWFLIGTLAFLAIMGVAVLRPRWAGWALIASAALAPLLLAVGDFLDQPGMRESMPWQVAAVFYGVPAVISGVLLLWSMRPRRQRDLPPREATPTRQPVDAATGQ